MISLRPYQENLISNLRASLVKHRHALAILPTGGGKTAIASFMAKSAKEKGKRIMFTCHRDFLLDQTAEAFEEIGLPYTFVAASRGFNPHAPVIIASMDTLKRRLDKVPAPDVLIVDEAVHAAAAGWARVIEFYQQAGCYSIGLTACSDRVGGQGLHPWFKDLVLGPSAAELIELGYLSKYRAFDHTIADLAGMKKVGGEYSMGQAASRMDKPSITGDAVKEYTKMAAGKQALMFCCSIEHSEHVAEAFRAAGYEACHIGANTDGATRAAMLRDYRAGKLKILTSVDIFNEGFNVPAAAYAGLLRPTESLSIFLQQCGRVLRPEKDKEYAFIFDHANNIRRKNGDTHHGFPDDPREWTLQDRKKCSRESGERTVPVRSCEKCYFCHKPAPVCPACGFVYPIQSREVEEVSGELAEIDKDRARIAARQEVGRTKTMDDLIALGVQRGYKNPQYWARMVFNSRQGKRA